MSERYTLAFDAFCIEFPQRTLFLDCREIKLGSRAVEILIALVEAAGALVSNQALMARVWPNTVVDEGALRVHLSVLRKALGESQGARLIVNDMGRGYRLATAVERRPARGEAETGMTEKASNLPKPIGRIVGRDCVITGLSTALHQHRLMTIAGAGGLGKTTVALEVARRFEAETGAKAFFVDFAPVTSASSAASTVALVMAVPVSSGDPIPSIIATVGDAPTLMVLDNCEHLIDEVSLLAERLLQGAHPLRLLVTSREPLRAEGEWVHRLAPLALPEDVPGMTVSSAMTYASVALFVERALAVDETFRLCDLNVDAVCNICRQLDGMPLAIELAAARIASMDAVTLSARLVDRFALLTRGRRNALPRQRTLRAMLDWSHALLNADTQAVLRRLSLFRAAFDIEAAIAVASDHAEPSPQDGSTIDEAMVVDAVADLVAKSLLVSNSRGSSTSYRLLESTRHYALDKLAHDDPGHLAKRRHALYVCSRLIDPESSWDDSGRKTSAAPRSATIDDVRAAFDWAASPDGDPALAVKVASFSSPLWFQLSLPYEFTRLATRALTAVAQAGMTGSTGHIHLQIAYGHAIWHTRGPSEDMAAAFAEALRHARLLGDPDIELRAMWGLWSQKLQSGQYPQSLEITSAYQRLAAASSHLSTEQTAKHTLALSLERLGRLQESMVLIEAVLLIDRVNPIRAGHANAAQVDGLISAWTLKMRLLWLLGDRASAMALARQAVQEIEEVEHGLSACFCLAMGVLPVALWCGETDFAVEVLRTLRAHTRRNGLRFWDKWADGYDAILHDGAFDISDATVYQMEIFATLGEPASLSALRAMHRAEEATWCQAELLRREAIRDGVSDLDAKRRLRRALAVASAQGAAGWMASSALAAATAVPTAVELREIRRLDAVEASAGREGSR